MDNWELIRNEGSYGTWIGYAFENLGIRHITQIKKALGIGGIGTVISSFRHTKTALAPGLQIDLVIERADRTTHLCEFKFSFSPIRITLSMATKLNQRCDAYRRLSKTKNLLFNTIVTVYAPNVSPGAGGAVDQVIQLEDLFS